MRKAQKQQIEETIKQMEEAHDEIKRCIEEGIAAQAQELLADCQNAAVAIGTLIEDIEGEGHPAVTVLEEYCEQVYQTHEALASEGSVNVNKIYKSLRQKLIKAQNSIRNDIKIRTEAVFLPYKASMWDSLESVWKAADADPDCDAYVIPIPYFDKNPDGSFKEEHYEGDQYPDYVPVTCYDTFDFGKHMPDVIYIHNGYDDCNIVTSVHPFFYSKNLKKFTDCLVYIPYFVLAEPNSENDDVVESIGHFCMIPGVFHADRVIVQSEAMKKVYIKVLIDATNDHGDAARKYWVNKIEGTGSPKFDKLLNTKKEDLVVPKEWLKVIEKPDGTWKKIIFYNISVSAILHDEDKLLRKMKSVFEIFKENMDEIVLLWRPHPLIQATIESMRPRLWEAYREIRNRYVEEGWGIYDDSADIDRVIILSDAYYGVRSSSVVQLYQKTGKPMMMQDVSFLQGDKTSLAMYNMIECKGEWWFFAFKDNCIYRMNKNSFEINRVVKIPLDEKMDGTMPQYGKIYICHGKIFLMPLLSTRIAVYDMNQEQIRYIDYGQNTNRGEVFWDGVETENALFLIPCAYEYILKIDIITEEVSYIELELDRDTPKEKRNYAWGSIYVNKTKVYFTKLLDNKILQIDLGDGSQQVYECQYLENGGAGICGNEKAVWIVPQKADKILCWDKETEELRVYNDFPTGYESGEWSFVKIGLYDKHLYLLPRDANMCIAVDTDSGEMRHIRLEDQESIRENYYDRYLKFSNIWRSKEEVYIMHTEQGKAYCISDVSLEVQVGKEIDLKNCDGNNQETDFILQFCKRHEGAARG